MTESDSGRKSVLLLVLKYGLLPTASIVVLCLVMKHNVLKRFQRRLFGFLWSNFSSKRFRRVLDPVKEDLFRDLKNILSRDPSLASKGPGCLRILEIGAGDGANFEYYPSGSHLTSVEPNPYFEKHFKENSQCFSSIVMEKFIRGCAEDMREVPSSSIDVVVSTHVLCSVSDIDKCLKEIHRVLVPGGKFVFLEHVSFQSCRTSYLLQVLIEPFWRLFSDGCRLTLKPEQVTEFPGMTSQRSDLVVIEGLYHVLKVHVVGISMKVPDECDFDESNKNNMTRSE